MRVKTWLGGAAASVAAVALLIYSGVPARIAFYPRAAELAEQAYWHKPGIMWLLGFRETSYEHIDACTESVIRSEYGRAMSTKDRKECCWQTYQRVYNSTPTTESHNYVYACLATADREAPFKELIDAIARR